MSELSVRHLLGIKYLSREDLDLIFETADHFKEVLSRSIKKVPSLRDITIANIFFENSTRTKLSFELAEKRLSADVINFSAAQSSVRKGETLIDTVNNILSMKVDMVVMRHPNPGAGIFLSRHVNASIINAGDGAHEHPTQALLDVFTIREKKGEIAGLNITILGDILYSRVARSNIWALRKLGANITLCGPSTLVPRVFEQMGCRVTYDMDDALANADVINLLRIQHERQRKTMFPNIGEYASLFGLTRARLAKTKPDAIIMHPGPMNRGVEIESEIADGDRAVILEQVTNGIAVRMSIIVKLMASQRDPEEGKE